MRPTALFLIALSLAAGCKEEAKPVAPTPSGGAEASQTVAASSNPAALADGVVTIPGIGLSLKLPDGFTRMPDRLAFQDKFPSKVVIEINLLHDDLAALNAFHLKNNDSTGAKAEPVQEITLDGRPWRFFAWRTPLDQNQNISGQGFMLATEDKAAGRMLVLEARLTSAVDTQYSDLIRQSLQTAKWDASAPIDLMADRGFTFQPAPGLKIAGLAAGALILNQSGLLKVQEGDEPRMQVIHKVLPAYRRNASKESREGAMITEAQQDFTLPNFRLEQGEWIYINGLNGFEFFGSCDRKGLEGRHVRYTAAVYDANGDLYQMVGVARQEDRARFLEAARATARTIKLKPAAPPPAGP